MEKELQTKRFIARSYVLSHLISFALVLALFVLIKGWSSYAWAAVLSREEAFSATSVAAAAIIGLIVFVNRKRFDPDGLVFGSTHTRRAAATLALFSLVYTTVLALVLLAALPPQCAPGCIEFTDDPLVLDLMRGLVPLLIIVFLGNGISNVVGYLICLGRVGGAD